jgi:predicted DNA-binding transcriptional regulator YafY
MPSATYRLFARAMRSRQQVTCSYHGFERELCPIMLGHAQDRERALAWQFAGGSGSGLPRSGAWKCLSLDKVADVRLRDGPWHAGARHSQPQSCMDSVDLDVNPASPYGPKRRLPRPRR